MKELELSQFTKYARHFFSGTFLSRISGMMRDVGMAVVFGDHPSVAAFMIAFRFSHFFRRILGEGALQSILIPQYQGLAIKDQKSASSFFFQLTSLLFFFLFALTLIVCMATAYFENEVASLFSYLFPSLLFICLYGLNTSLLQCHHSFFLSSIAPLVCNMTWLVGIFWLRSYGPKEAMPYLCLFTTAGFIAQWAITFPKIWPTLKEGYHSFKGSLLSLSVEIKTIGKATLFGLIGVTAVQINSFLDMIFARFADAKGPIYLWYAIRLQQLPVALIGFACIYSITPSLSKYIKSLSIEQAQTLFQFGKHRILLFVTLATFALFALGFASVDLLFGHGNFSQDAVLKTTSCLMAYGIGLLPTILAIYYAAIFYAFDDYKTPTWASLISVGANLIFNTLFVFVFELGALSIALSTSGAALINMWILKRSLPLPSLPIDIRKVFLIATSALGLATAFHLLYRGNISNTPTFSSQCIYFIAQSLLFSATLIGAMRLLDKKLFQEIKSLVFYNPR